MARKVFSYKLLNVPAINNLVFQYKRRDETYWSADFKTSDPDGIAFDNLTANANYDLRYATDLEGGRSEWVYLPFVANESPDVQSVLLDMALPILEITSDARNFIIKWNTIYGTEINTLPRLQIKIGYKRNESSDYTYLVRDYNTETLNIPKSELADKNILYNVTSQLLYRGQIASQLFQTYLFNESTITSIDDIDSVSLSADNINNEVDGVATPLPSSEVNYNADFQFIHSYPTGGWLAREVRTDDNTHFAIQNDPEFVGVYRISRSSVTNPNIISDTINKLYPSAYVPNRLITSVEIHENTITVRWQGNTNSEFFDTRVLVTLRNDTIVRRTEIAGNSITFSNPRYPSRPDRVIVTARNKESDTYGISDYWNVAQPRESLNLDVFIANTTEYDSNTRQYKSIPNILYIGNNTATETDENTGADYINRFITPLAFNTSYQVIGERTTPTNYSIVDRTYLAVRNRRIYSPNKSNFFDQTLYSTGGAKIAPIGTSESLYPSTQLNDKNFNSTYNFYRVSITSAIGDDLAVPTRKELQQELLPSYETAPYLITRNNRVVRAVSVKYNNPDNPSSIDASNGFRFIFHNFTVDAEIYMEFKEPGDDRWQSVQVRTPIPNTQRNTEGNSAFINNSVIHNREYIFPQSPPKNVPPTLIRVYSHEELYSHLHRTSFPYTFGYYIPENDIEGINR